MLLRLLGPFTAVAGQPITLCWRLERSAAGPAGAADWASGEAAAAAAEGCSQDAVIPLQYEALAEVGAVFLHARLHPALDYFCWTAACQATRSAAKEGAYCTARCPLRELPCHGRAGERRTFPSAFRSAG